jgi:N-acetylmuramoyl-L-alanine amidase-like protein
MIRLDRPLAVRYWLLCSAATLMACGPGEREADPEDAPASAAAALDAGGARRRAFANAARESKVPESVLLALSYLESRWDGNAGRPSRGAGYGPMHLTDARSALRTSHHGRDAEDPRGDEARPFEWPEAAPSDLAPALRTLALAAELTGIDAEALRADPEQNVRGGAALLAEYQLELTGALSPDPADWYGAVARYGGAADAAAARQFADEVYATLAEGAERVTDDGQRVALAARPDVRPRRGQLDWLGLRQASRDGVECPDDVDCEWLPAPYVELGAGDYGNHDQAERPKGQRVEYIVIHDTEGSYDGTLSLVQDPNWVSWHYTLRSSDGHIAQHVKTEDVAWHAGNWYVNAKAVGLEHEGFAAQGTWYTEAMYRTSAKLVRHLAFKLGVPLDRAHIIGHDNVPGPTPSSVRNMHWDPGPYWDWAHYFELLGAPLWQVGSPHTGMVMIKPDYATNQPAFFGCDPAQPAAPCPARSSSSVVLRAEPRPDAPLLKDPGLHPDGSDSTMRVSDVGSRVDAGQQYAVAGRQGDWTAIWYLGQKGWFYDPPGARNALWAIGLVATPAPGKETIPVYGRAYPEASAYPAGIAPQSVVPLQYALPAGQRYALGAITRGEYYYATTFDPADHVVVRGDDVYYQIQFGHRVAFVRAEDVRIVPSPVGAP